MNSNQQDVEQVKSHIVETYLNGAFNARAPEDLDVKRHQAPPVARREVGMSVSDTGSTRGRRWVGGRRRGHGDNRGR